MRNIMKILLYITEKNSFVYFMKNPIRALKNLKILLSSSDYQKFVSLLTDRPLDVVKSFMPKEESVRYLTYVFKRSIGASEAPIGFEEAMSLYLIVRILRPRYVVETGVAAGRSSAFILCALHDNNKGELFSIDPDPRSGYAIPKELKYRWHFVNSTSQESLPELLRNLGYIDMFLHDSLHTYEVMFFEYISAWPLIKRGGVLLSHDISFNSAFEDFCKNVIKAEGKVVYLNKNFAGIRKL